MDLVYPIPSDKTIQDELNKSEIKDHFRDATIFITGGSGFLGSLVVEKFLRSCPEVKRIYMLMRPKKGVDIEKRFSEYFDRPFFEPLKHEQPKAILKVFTVMGDCAEPNLGLSDQDRAILVSEVNYIIHLAATVRFDEKLRTAAHINVRATQDVLKLAKEVKHLQSVVHVSTAFSNCPSKNIGEIFYPTTITGDQLLALVDAFNDDMLEELKPTILGKWPNTYAFTKIIAENVVQNHSGNLPIAIVRPSIVVSTAKEPIPGWIDNYYGAAGVFVGAGIGLLRTLQCVRNNIAEIIPADYVINHIIATAWDTAKTKSNNNIEANAEEKQDAGCDIEVYNCVSGNQNPISWGKALDLGFERGASLSTVLQIWHPFLILTPYKPLQIILHYILHVFPAYIVDFFALCFGKPRQLVKAYQKITKFLGAIEYFSSREWRIDDQNTQKMWKKLNSKDREVFNFDITTLNWYSYMHDFLVGLRVHLVHDPVETIPQGIKRHKKIKIAHYILVSVICLLFVRFLWWVLTTIINSVFF